MRRNLFNLIVVAVIALFALVWGVGVLIYSELLWFAEVGFTDVYVKTLTTKIYLGLIFGAVFFLFILVNLLIARRLTPIWRIAEEKVIESIRSGFNKRATLVLVGFALFFSFIAGTSAPARWDTVLSFLNATPFGVSDPLFDKDVGFFHFTLPFYRYLFEFLLGLGLATIVAVSATHFFNGGITWNVFKKRVEVAPGTRAHLSVLAGLVVLLKGWDYLLRQYELVFSSRGAAFGASYADISAQLPVLKVLVGIAVVSGILLFVNAYVKGVVLPIAGAILIAITSVVGGTAYPALVQRYVVAPNELAKEERFIKYNIDFTRQAYGLSNVKEQMFPAEDTLVADDLANNVPTLSNIRLWDWRPLKKTYSQLQEIRLYYTFNDIDVDRYRIGGQYRQILLSPREMSVDQLPAKAKTWVNQHIVYTHGHGAALSPASEVSREGLPNLIVKNIPPETPKGLEIKRPEIYFGEEVNNYALVKTRTREFDFPEGDQNRYTRYAGRGGVEVGGLTRRSIFAWKFGDIQLLVSGALTPKSRILFRREIKSRVRAIAPFLQYDSDPYLVISQGRFFWMLDAYTVSDRYPYSEPFNGRDNYIRNSVKIVVDAYHGDVKFYVVDADDPIVKTYAKIFPELFTRFDKMPRDLRDHVRYPMDLFKVQSHIYATYHMKDPQVFYNKEDQWAVPTEIFGGGEEEVEPYYVIMRLPGEKKEKFLMLLPFTPVNKNNMISWLSANSDFPDYGELLVYKFPKQKLVFGPQQIEARINQDPDISRQFTLWGQQGSEIIRGNLLVIPIEDSLLYVEPLYLQAERSELPELKRVLVSYGNRIVMEENLEESLKKVFETDAGIVNETASAVGGTEQDEDETEETLEKLIERAVGLLDAALEKQRQGDWAGYGDEVDELEKALRDLREQATGNDDQ
ncbi:MAG: UPF0182 family protein [Terriglobia bacterium]